MSHFRLPALIAGRYSVLKVLGEGGMGRVLEVHDTVVDRTVALKLMRDDVLRRGFSTRRFEREYRAMAKLEHPSVPRVYDAGIDEVGRPYFTMDLIRGQPLTTALDAHEGAHRILSVGAEIARILVVVHTAGIVHRDIKPSNILVGSDDRLYLVDFGAAYMKYDNDRGLTKWSSTPLRTAPGTWLGTPGYVDPATLEGLPCTPRSDVYSLAATIAWMFTRTHPSTDAYASVPRTGVAAIDGLLRRGLAKNPDDRPVTAEEFLAELSEARAALVPTLQEARAVRAHGSRKLSPRAVLALGMGGGILGGTIGGVFLEGRWDGDASTIQVMEPYSSPKTDMRPDIANNTAVLSSVTEDVSSSRFSGRLGLSYPASSSSSSSESLPPRPQIMARRHSRPRSGPLTSWVDVLEKNRDDLAACLSGLRLPPGRIRISLVVDGRTGSFRSIMPLNLSGRGGSCIRTKLSRLKFNRFSERIEVTIGLMVGGS